MNATSFEVVATDGVALHGRRWAHGGHPTANVVIVHGFGASSGEAKVVALAEALHDHGESVLALDARGHGASGGEATLGDRERLDVAAAVAATVNAHEDASPPAPIVLVAASVGAIAALRFLAGEPGVEDRTSAIAGIVIVSCPARWSLPRNARGILSALLTHTPPGRRVARRSLGIRIARPAPRPAPPIDLIPKVAVPVAIVHGSADPFIPVDDARALYAVAPDPRQLELVDGMGHAFEPEAIQPVISAVDWVLAHR
jgi:alpha-beta hydrolase superfamily lysophospholipase